MKMMKKAAAMILSVCLTVPMFGTIVSAAQGQLMFSDPERKVGDTDTGRRFFRSKSSSRR